MLVTNCDDLRSLEQQCSAKTNVRAQSNAQHVTLQEKIPEGTLFYEEFGDPDAPKNKNINHVGNRMTMTEALLKQHIYT